MVRDQEELAHLLERLGVSSPTERDRLVSGSAAIHDFTPVLLCDRETESDFAFVQRCVQTIMGGGERRLENRSLEMLTNGISRERMIFAILRSP